MKRLFVLTTAFILAAVFSETIPFRREYVNGKYGKPVGFAGTGFTAVDTDEARPYIK